MGWWVAGRGWIHVLEGVSPSTSKAMLESDEVPSQGNVSNSLRLPCKEWLEAVPRGVVGPVLFGLNGVLNRCYAW